MLKKMTVEASLNAEIGAHLGYDKHQLSKSKVDNLYLALL